MKEIHFFDVDNTITACSTSVQYLFQGIRDGILPFSPVFAVPRLMMKYKSGVLSFEKIYRQGIPFLTGKKRQTLQSLAEVVFRKRIFKYIYSDAVRIIRELQDEGKEVVLATSAVDLVVEPLKRYLKVETCLSTSLVFKEDVCTGSFRELVFEEDKKKKVLAFLAERGGEPGDCYFYSDSIHDLPLLAEVGYPVVVNPDRKLKQEAMKREWQLLDFSATLG